MANCEKCGIAPSCTRVWKGMHNCTYVVFVPIKTRADWLRSLTDDEMAGELAKHGCYGDYCPYFPRVCLENAPKEKWLEWLKKEVNDGIRTNSDSKNSRE